MADNQFNSFPFSSEEWELIQSDLPPSILKGGSSREVLSYYEIIPKEGRQYGLDYPRSKRDPDPGVLQVAFIGQQHIRASDNLYSAWYVRMSMKDREGRIVPDAWLSLQNPEDHGQVGDKEYIVPFIREPVDGTLYRDKIDVYDAFLDTFSKQGFTLLGVTGFRIRGHVTISRIEIVRRPKPHEIQYGDRIRLLHKETEKFLTVLPELSTDSSTSGKFVVRATNDVGVGSIWIVHRQYPLVEKKQSLPNEVFSTNKVRLYSKSSQQYLYSDNTPASISRDRQFEVMVRAEGKRGNEWQVLIPEDDRWFSQQPIKLQHVPDAQIDSEPRFLHSHDHLKHHLPELPNDEQSVTCCADNNDEDIWIALRIEGLPSSDEPKFTFSSGAESILRKALSLANESRRAGITTSCVLFAIAEQSDQSDVGRYVRIAMDSTGQYDTEFKAFMEDSGNPKQQSASDAGGWLGKVSENVRAVLENASKIAVQVSPGSWEIDERHLFAALIVTPESGGQSRAWKRLQALGLKLSVLREQLLKIINKSFPQDDSKEWMTILAPAANEFLSGPAGYTPEFCGMGVSRPVADHLGVEALAHRLAELIALRETKLPLAIGLFGNWGSGKSHFMNLMDQHIRKLAQETPEGESHWCREIVPIYFNAWHYLDSNLWASLVTEIFDGLFRHVAGGTDSAEKVTKLLAELQKANGVAASAEDSFKLTTVAKAQAEDEEREAETATLRAAHQRDRLRAAMDGVLDNLEKLLPDEKMNTGWRDAVRVLHLSEARKSFTVLSAQVEEFRSLQGRARAIGRAVLEREGRAVRLAWLAGAVLVAPLIVGLATWGLTYWSAEIRQVGLVTGEVTGLLAAVGTWCGAQLQRGRRYLGQIEELEKAAQKERTATEQSPKLKCARAKIVKCMEKEEQGRALLKEARAKVRRLEEELRELRPERRLFRFIEQRAQAQDYRAHLGLVSLVRRDFHELSRLFAETEAEAQSMTEHSEGEKENKEKLGASIDRIVLFIDDLDRCQPEKVVDVLQAVHLLLAFPLFAVVVGVDQRCLRRSLQMQFKGLLKHDREVGSIQDRNRGHEESPATPLDYLEKIFHVPFHLPPMDQHGFSKLIDHLTKSPSSTTSTQKDARIGDDSSAISHSSSQVDQSGVMRDAATQEKMEDAVSAVTDKIGPAPFATSVDAPPDTVQMIGSVPLQPWEGKALSGYHSLIQTPRGATRLLNTYRLVRAGIPAGQWSDFKGDGITYGEFRVAMLLLAVAAGHPAVARDWFEQLRITDPPTLSLPKNKSVMDAHAVEQFNKLSGATILPTTMPLTKVIIAKWIDRVEQFAF